MLFQDGVAYQRGVEKSTVSTILRFRDTMPRWFHRNNSPYLLPEAVIPRILLRRNYQQELPAATQVSPPSPGALILILLNVLALCVSAYERTRNEMSPSLAYDPTPAQQAERKTDTCLK